MTPVEVTNNAKSIHMPQIPSSPRNITHSRTLSAVNFDNTQSISAMQSQQPTSKRFYLLTYPRTASNLLVKILSLENQPSLLDSKSEYFFAKTLAWKLGPAKLGGKSISEWSNDEKTGLRDSFSDCANSLEDVCKRAEKEGKDIYVKEHVNWILDPVAETSWAFGKEEKGMQDEVPWTINVNDSISQSQSHSTGNETIFSDEFLRTWLYVSLLTNLVV